MAWVIINTIMMVSKCHLKLFFYVNSYQCTVCFSRVQNQKHNWNVMSAFWRQKASVRQLQDSLADVKACPSETASPLFQPPPHKSYVKAE